MHKDVGTMTKIYRISNNENKTRGIECIVSIIVYAFVLILASRIFRGIYVDDFISAIIAAIILSVLNTFVKPVVVALTLPLNIMTLGLSYPIVNVIILKICDIIMGNSFEINGLLSSFIIAIFISFMKIILDKIITKNV